MNKASRNPFIQVINSNKNESNQSDQRVFSGRNPFIQVINSNLC